MVGELVDAVHNLRDRAVRDGVDPASSQLFAQLGVPVVLNVIVGSARELVRNDGPPEWEQRIGPIFLKLDKI